MDIAQTPDGYLWIATLGGVVRFDGVRFETFRKDNEPGLRSDDVNGLFVARDGTLWINTNGGGVSYREPGRAEGFSHLEGLPSESIASVLEDSHGVLWIGTFGSGLLRRENGVVTSLTTANGLANNTVWELLEDSEGRIWIATSRGLNRLDGDRLVRVRGCGEEATIRALVERGTGAVWAGTDGAGICREAGEGMVPVETSRGLRYDTVFSLAEERDGTLWAGTRSEGLFRFIGQKADRILLQTGALTNSIMALFEDRDGIIWIGSRGAGLTSLVDGAISTTSIDEGLPVGMVWSILEDRSGALWIGTEGGGLVRIDEHGERWWTTAQGLGSNRIWALAEAPDGSIWIGNRVGGLHHLTAGGEIVSYTIEDGLPATSVRAIEVDRRGRVWVGTDGGGLALVENGRLIAVPPGLQPPHPVVRSILEDHSGALWVGTLGGGLSRIDDEGRTTYRASDGLASDLVTALYEDEDHVLWIGSRGGGLTRLVDGELGVLSVRQGLLDDNVFAILEDASGHLWLSSNQGVFRVEKKQIDDVLSGRLRRVETRLFNESDGMRNSECNGWAQPSGWRDHDGRLWFATVDGAIAVDTKRLARIEPPKPVRIDRALADGVALELGERIVVPAGAQEVQVWFAAFAFAHAEDLSFSYRLGGLSERWLEIHNRRILYFTTLPPGSYLLEIRVRNRWVDHALAVTSLPITVRPRFFQTLWFRGVIALAVLAVPFGIYRLRIEMVRRQKRELERVVHERTAQLEEKRDQLAKLDRVVRSINTEDEVANLLSALLSEMRVIRGLERAVAIVRDQEEEEGVFRIVATIGWEEEPAQKLLELQLTEEQVEQRNIEGAEEILPDLFLTKRHADRHQMSPDSPRSRMVMRVRIEGEVQAYLVFTNYRHPDAFDEQDIQLLSSLQAHLLSAFHKLSRLAHLRLLNEKKNELLGFAAHDLRNPLGLIASWVRITIQRLRKDRTSVDQGIAHLERALRATEHMMHLVTGIVDLSAIESGKMSLERGRQSLRTIFSECEEFYSSIAREKDIRLVVETEPEPPPVWADRVRVLEVLGNLVSNAIKYTYSGGVVRVFCESAGDDVVVHVEDNGQGLSPDDLENLFQSFRTLSAKPTAGEESIGLGLAIVKKIIELHGGRIWAESAKGQGARFSFTLPLAA